jgi:hypothetical protein
MMMDLSATILKAQLCLVAVPVGGEFQNCRGGGVQILRAAEPCTLTAIVVSNVQRDAKFYSPALAYSSRLL